MAVFTLGQKQNSTHLFNDKGEYIPVTFIMTTPCFLIGVKWPEKHGYMALRLGFGQTKNINKPQQGELDKAGIKTPLRFLREFRIEKKDIKIIDEGEKKGIEVGGTKLLVGQELAPAIFFKKGDLVEVSGTSKGKGFQGVVKRHGFKGGPKTHGQSDRHRGPGSVGQSTTPGRVYKGKRMAGRMGSERITVKNLEVIEVQEKGILIKGVVPGAKQGLVEIVRNS